MMFIFAHCMAMLLPRQLGKKEQLGSHPVPKPRYFEYQMLKSWIKKCI